MGNTEVRNALMVYLRYIIFLIATALPIVVSAQPTPSDPIIIGIGNNYPPYSFLDESGIDVGYNFDISRAVGAAIQEKFEIRVGPWVEIRKALENGEIDAIAGMLYSEERDRILDFSAPYTNIHQAIFVNKNIPDIETEQDLVGKRIVVQRGDIMHDYVLENQLDQKLTVVASQTEALGLLTKGDHDLALLAQLPGLYYRNELELMSIDTTGPLLLSLPYGFAVRQGNSRVLHLLNEGLATLGETGGHKVIYDKWLGSLNSAEHRVAEFMKFVVVIALSVAVMMILFFVWSRVLRRQVEQRTNDLLNQSQITTRMQEGSMLIRDSDLSIIYANPALEKMFRYEPGETVGKSVSALNSPNNQSPEEVKRIIAKGIQEHGIWSGEVLCVRKDGSDFTSWVTSSSFQHPVHGEVGVTIVRDTTAQKRMEREINQAQKLESIGQLTGGVAHDFNNLLAAIMGSLELLRDDETDAEKLSLIDTGIRATQRGAELTRNMLAFARRARLEPTVIELNTLVNETCNWAGRTLPSKIEVETLLTAGLWPIKVDVSSIESSLLNLILNARDAMPEGGKLTIKTANVRIDETYLDERSEKMEFGQYVMLAVSDTGHGIPSETLEHIFEPFFSTKVQGAGTGLGLSMILGFMQQSGGAVQVYSEPNAGTTFKLYFKAFTGEVKTTVVESIQTVSPKGGGQKILVAEDEDSVRSILTATLKRAGYDVSAAGTGDDALALFEANPTFDLLLTDLVMPGSLQGVALSRVIREQAPNLPVVFMSGYASEATIDGNRLQPEDIRLNKPVMRSDLLAAIKKSLGD